MSNSTETIQLGLRVPAAVYKGLGAMADKAGTSRTGYAQLLLIAAYSARCAPSGDRDLDAAVGRVAVLWGEGLDTAAIAKAVGLSEPTVVRIVGAWRAELSGKAT